MISVPLSRSTRRHIQGIVSGFAGYGTAWALGHTIDWRFCVLGMMMTLITYVGEIKIERIGVPNQFGARLSAMAAAWMLWLLMGGARAQVSPLVVVLVGYFAGRLSLRFYVEGSYPQLPSGS